MTFLIPMNMRSAFVYLASHPGSSIILHQVT